MKKFKESQKNISVCLKEAISIMGNYNYQTSIKELKSIKTKLFEEAFEVMVVGEFNGGKSTFINALMGDEIMPAGMDPTTAVITKIQYGKESYELVYKTGRKKKVAVQEFQKYIAPKIVQKKMGKFSSILNRTRRTLKALRNINISYPSRMLEGNIRLIDTPGTNDLDEGRVAITNYYLPQSEAILFVLDAAKTLSNSELNFLKRILSEDIHKIFFIINKADRLKKEEEKEEIVNHLQTSLEGIIDEPKYVFVSARDALYHNLLAKGVTLSKRRTRRMLPYDKTGIENVKEELTLFLTEVKGLAKLERTVLRSKQVINFFINKNLKEKIESLNMENSVIESKKKQIEKDMKLFEKELEVFIINVKRAFRNKNKEIIHWYENSLNRIGQVAKKFFNQAKSRGRTVSYIKESIESETVLLEKETFEQLKEKIHAEMNEILSENAADMKKVLENTSINIDEYIKIEKRPELKIDETSDGNLAYVAGGAALGTVAANAIGAGFIVSGLIIGAFSLLASEIEVDRKDVDVYKELEYQINLRYFDTIGTQLNEMESSLNKIQKNLLEKIERNIKSLIDDNKLKAQNMFENTQLEKEEIENRKKKILQSEKQLSSVSRKLTSILKNYSTIGEG